MLSRTQLVVIDSSLTAASDIEHVWQNGYRMGFYRGGPVLMSALSGVDIALWDLKGEQSIPNRGEPAIDSLQPAV